MSQSLSISTAKTYLSLSPGEVFSGEITVSNISAAESALVSVVPAPFAIQDESYALTFEEPSDHTQILSWLTLDVPSEPLVPGEQGTVTFEISVPDTAPAGGQYFALLFSSVDPEAEKQLTEKSVNIENTAKIASLFYVTVAGETKREITVLENNVKMFYFNSPISVSSFLKNSSNVHVPVEYSLTVSSAFDGAELYSSKDSPDTRTLLPDTKFFNASTWDDTPTLGLFKVAQTISYLGKTDVSETYALVCPLWFLVLVLAFILALFYALIDRILRRHKTRDNREKQASETLKNV